MKNLAIILGLLIMLPGGGCQQSQESSAQSAEVPETQPEAQNTLSAVEQEQGWQLLFDGSSSDQWRGYLQEQLPGQGWEVQDGELVVLRTPEGGSGGGDIITRKQYENFELSLEFMVSDTANSGILYLAIEQEGKPIWHSAPEYQILDNETYKNMEGNDMDMHTHLTAENYDLQAADNDYTNPVGEWNQARIVVNKGHVEHWLNGHKTIEYDINSPAWTELVKGSKFSEYPEYGQAKRGHIGIQDHGHEVRFRNIKIKEL